MFSQSFSRKDRSVLGQWWLTIDRWLFIGVCVLILIGMFLSFSASSGVAHTLELDSFFFVRRHAALLIPVLVLMVSVSLLSPQMIRLFSWGLLALCIALLIATPFIGMEIKGARRWITLGGFSIQASEFAKPAFVVVAAWLFALRTKQATLACVGLYVLLVTLFLLQPDFGMVFVLSTVWLVQLFLIGLPLVYVYILGGAALTGIGGAYALFPHVASRINRFLNPEAGDQYQVMRSLEAFRNGGIFGKGPGEGVIKKSLPDAHADFVFSVAGEEFGLIMCLSIIGLYLFIIGRVLYRIMGRRVDEANSFVFLAVIGLVFQFSIQIFINMGSSLNLIPTKGMTLPFLSYGGSSFLSTAIAMGMILGLTRKRLPGKES